MNSKISIQDFDFIMLGYGRYGVTYTSPTTYKRWSTTIDDMTIIDSTKNSDKPLIKDLNILKRMCKKYR